MNSNQLQKALYSLVDVGRSLTGQIHEQDHTRELNERKSDLYIKLAELEECIDAVAAYDPNPGADHLNVARALAELNACVKALKPTDPANEMSR